MTIECHGTDIISLYRYHVPRSWLKPSSNLLVLFEETGGNPFKISVKTVTAGILCGQVSESHYPPLRKWSTPDYINGTMSINSVAPEVHLYCEDGHVISSIEFASYGTPRGSCDGFSIGKCHASNSLSIVSEVKLYCLQHWQPIQSYEGI